MIVVTVGTQFFDELIEEVDRLVASGRIRDKVWAQIGLAQRAPQHLDYVLFDAGLVDRARRADLIISHSGTGSLCEFITLGRPLIAVVNPSKADNHQLEFVQELSRFYDYCWISSPDRLGEALAHPRIPVARRRSTLPELARDIRAALVGR